GGGYQDTRPGRRLHAWAAGVEAAASMNYDRDRYPGELLPYGTITWKNFWTTSLNALVLTPGYDDGITRGGPLLGTGWGGTLTLAMSSAAAARNLWRGSITHAYHQTGESGLTAT